jgi:hypothetical protein
MGGTLTIRHGRSALVSTALRRVEHRGWLIVSGTLLGPEGAAVWLGLRYAGPSELHASGCGGDGWLVVA